MIRTSLHHDALTLASRNGATVDSTVRTLRVLGYSPLESLTAVLDLLMAGVLFR